jgi:hypothetical protein
MRWNFGAAPQPTSWGLALQEDTIATHFTDALYVTDRIAELVVAQVEAEF